MRGRSKGYKKVFKGFADHKERFFSIEKAISEIKKSARANFPEAVELHVRIHLDKKAGTQVIRGTVTFPKTPGKKKRIAVFVVPEKVKEAKKAGAKIAGGEELILKIKNSKKINFDLALAEPAMMRHLGQIGKLLGQKGLMPNPKDETVTPKIIEAIREFAQGKTSFKSDEQGIIHQVIGRVSFQDEDLIKNFNTLIKQIKKQKPENQKGEFIDSISICTTMGPALRIKV